MTGTGTMPLHNPIHPVFWVRPEAEVEADLAALREGPPVFLPEPESALGQGPGAWVVTRLDDILEVSRTPEVWSSAQGITTLDAPPEFAQFFGSMIAMDDPRHAHLRRLVSPGFTPRMLRKLEASVQEQAARIIDDVGERGECDFVVDVAARLPLRVICDLMGVPESQHEFVFRNTNVILGAADPEYLPEGTDPITALLQAGQQLAQLMTDVAAHKEGGDADDLTTVLVNAKVEGGDLSYGDIASFFVLLVVAGNETTRNAISWGLTYLSTHPEQRRVWAEDFEAVAPTAVEEIVRLASPVAYMRRTATCDTRLHGQPVAEGDKVLLFYLAANRDEAHFADPYAFDVRRAPNPHVGFGGPGPHFCLGAHLARREITVMFRELFSRLPDIEASGPPALLASSFIHGIKHLPAAFTPVAPPR